MRPEGLAELYASDGDGDGTSSGGTGPSLVAQEFIDHGGVVYKGYTVGEALHVDTRPSLPDIGPADARADLPSLIRIDSQSSLVDALSAYSNGKSEGAGKAAANETSAAATLAARRHDIDAILIAVRAHMGVLLLGVDLLMARDGRLFVVDVNHFSGAPSTVPGFAEALARVVAARGASTAGDAQVAVT